MTHKALADLNLEGLKKCASEQLQTQPVTAVLLALGSNHQAEKYLPRAREKLVTLGKMQLSTAFQNPDFTSTLKLPKPDYTNQCVYLVLSTPVNLQQLQQIFKQIESDCHRQRLTTAQTPINPPIETVTMDIDILLVKLGDKQNSLSKKWIIMADRYPFKAHEMAGIEELRKEGSLNG